MIRKSRHSRGLCYETLADIVDLRISIFTAEFLLADLKMSFYYPSYHRVAGGSILLVHCSMIILKPAILGLKWLQ